MEALKEQRDIVLLANRKDNQVQTYREKKLGRKYHEIRFIVETVNARLQGQLHLSKHYAKSTRGLFTGIAAKITAHTLGMLINTLFGRPKLALATLAV